MANTHEGERWRVGGIGGLQQVDDKADGESEGEGEGKGKGEGEG